MLGRIRYSLGITLIKLLHHCHQLSVCIQSRRILETFVRPIPTLSSKCQHIPSQEPTAIVALRFAAQQGWDPCGSLKP